MHDHPDLHEGHLSPDDDDVRLFAVFAHVGLRVDAGLVGRAHRVREIGDELAGHGASPSESHGTRSADPARSLTMLNVEASNPSRSSHPTLPATSDR